MRRLEVIGAVVVALVGLLGLVPIASAGGPPEDRVAIIGPLPIEVVDCDGESITRTASGWIGPAADVEDVTAYHLTWVYSNAAGTVWTYIDTGLVRVFERDGELYVSLSGRSVNVGPDGTGWVGHWEFNTATDEVRRAGLGVGAIDQLACNVLALSS